MELYQIRYFLAVAETLNFTRAAERSNVTQPALTRAVQRLEEELGGLLFRRERNLTHLTDFGQLMQPRLERILSEADAAKTTARSFLRLDRARLNLGVMCTVGPLRFIGFLAAFQAEHPGIEVTLHEQPAPELAESLVVGTRDVAVLASAEPLGERCDVRPLYDEPFVVAFPHGHRFADLRAVPMTELAGERYLSRLNCEYDAHIGALFQERGIEVEEAYRSTREDWVQTMILAGMGICCMPSHLPVLPGLQTRPLVDPPVLRQVALVTIAGRRFSPAVAAFVREIARHPWTDGEPPAAELLRRAV
ncbi:MAG: LysR family transcriptional regulator [Alphaproteobacteria bacterium]|nr:LysR family transcriptional regulator [Alphaproteobacteria bacterium]